MKLECVCFGAALAMAQFAAAANPVTIMPLGDSITFGNSTGGYRAKLWQDYGSDPSRVDFVGSVWAGDSPLGDYDNEGHSSYTIDQINNNLDGNDASSGNNGGFWLTGIPGRPAVYPDIILLMIGDNNVTADLGATRDRLDALVGHIFALRPNTDLIVSNLIPRADSLDSWIQQYNALIPAVVAKYDGLGNECFFVDMYSKLTVADISPDNVHPLQSGYDKMGDAWYGAIQAIPEPCSLVLLVTGLFGLLAYAWRRRRRFMI